MNIDSVATSGPRSRATLSVAPDGLELNGTLGRFQFSPQAVTRVQRAGLFPWFWGGLRIRHTVAKYPHLVQFCPMGARSRDILVRLRELGFPTS